MVANAVSDAIRIGYRNIDCASVYGNEHLMGHVLHSAIQNGVRREDLWITSKLWNDKHSEQDVILSIRKSLKDLQLDYLGIALNPLALPGLFHAPNVDVTSRDPHAVPYSDDSYMRTWRQLEKAVQKGWYGISAPQT